MKKFVFGTILVLLAVFTSACGTTNSSSEMNKTMPDPIEVTLFVPGKAAINQKILLKALVKQGKELVKDADEVKYETWKENSEEKSRMIDAKNEDNGTYTARVKFEQPGTYFVQVHVTARSMHDMPKTKIIINK